MAVQEQGTQREALSPAELGEKAHQAIASIIEDLTTTPEFANAVVKRFFARSFRDTEPLTAINYGINFTKGDYNYSVKYSAPPIRHNNQTLGAPVSSWLSIRKYDPGKRDENNYPTRICSITLSTKFNENDGGKITGFESGGAFIEDETGRHQNTQDVFGKIAEVLKDLTQPIML